MKLKKLMLGVLALFCVMPLSGCAKKKHNIEEYILETPYKDDFKILQLTDIHMSNKDERDKHYDFIRKTIEACNPDMIISTGDNFTFGTKRVAKELFAFFDSFGIPWTVTWGNHDEQCYFSIDWVTNYLNNYGSHCLFKDLQDDDVYGNANFAINLMKDGKPFEQVIIVDSNRYNYGEYTGYDYIKKDQILLYEDIVNHTTQVAGHVVPSHMFFHIPFPEFEEAYNKVETGEATLICGENREAYAAPLYNSGLWDKILQLGSTKSVNVGHDHINDATVLYKGVYLSFGVTSTDRIYYDEDMLGGKLITLHNDHTYSFENVFFSY